MKSLHLVTLTLLVIGAALVSVGAQTKRAFVRQSQSIEGDEFQISAMRHQTTGACFVVVRASYQVYGGESVAIAVTPAPPEVCK